MEVNMELTGTMIGYFRSEMDFIIKEAAQTATKTNPELWEQAKAEAKAKMGGKHSARAMQLATQIYKKKGGGYSGAKPTAKNNSLKKWGKQKWKWSKEKKASKNIQGLYQKYGRPGRKAVKDKIVENTFYPELERFDPNYVGQTVRRAHNKKMKKIYRDASDNIKAKGKEARQKLLAEYKKRKEEGFSVVTGKPMRKLFEKKANMMNVQAMQAQGMNPTQAMQAAYPQGLAQPQMPGYKNGGIVKKDPKGKGRIIRVAEDGDEAIIPLTKKKQARRVAKSILRKTK